MIFGGMDLYRLLTIFYTRMHDCCIKSKNLRFVAPIYLLQYMWDWPFVKKNCYGWFVGDVCFSVLSFFGGEIVQDGSAAVGATNAEPTETYFTPAWFNDVQWYGSNCNGKIIKVKQFFPRAKQHKGLVTFQESFAFKHASMTKCEVPLKLKFRVIFVGYDVSRIRIYWSQNALS